MGPRRPNGHSDELKTTFSRTTSVKKDFNGAIGTESEAVTREVTAVW